MTSKSKPKQKIVVRVELYGPLKERFEYLLKYYGSATNTALVRLLIDMKHEELIRTGEIE